MDLRLLFVAICLLQAAVCFTQNEKYVVRPNAAPCLNVRATNSTSSTSIACLIPGTEVIVVGSAPFWREITFGNNQRGWVAKKFIEPAPGATPEQPVAEGIPENAFLTIHFVDVGQGDAIWIQTFDDGIDNNGKFEGYSIVIDGGPYSSDNTNPLLPYMENQGHHNADIEAVLVSHPHDDHYSGAETISRHFQINHYYDPGYPSPLAGYNAFLNAMKGTPGHPGRAKHVHIGRSKFGTLNWGSELKVEVLYAWGGDSDNTLGSGNTEINNSSIVLRIEYGDHVFLFMGDA
jgi:beta-lactamase superfamily II metal-dependent hydrolase